MRLGLSGSKVAIKSFVFSIGLVAEKQQFCATRLSDFHELSRAASPWGQLWQFWQSRDSVLVAALLPGGFLENSRKEAIAGVNAGQGAQEVSAYQTSKI